MDVREAYERRVWRIALLLTDDTDAAQEILLRVVGVQPELHKVGDTRLDRMVVQASREPGASGGKRLEEIVDLDDETRGVWDGVRDLAPQPREAWVFLRVEALDPIRAAQAMDCSRTAMEEVHFEGARRTLEARFGAERVVEATRRLSAALEELDASEAIELAATRRAAVYRRRRKVSALLFLVLLVCFGLMTFVLFDLLDWQREADNGKLPTDTYTTPGQPSGPTGTVGSNF